MMSYNVSLMSVEVPCPTGKLISLVCG
jgi:hypothetical protein